VVLVGAESGYLKEGEEPLQIRRNATRVARLSYKNLSQKEERLLLILAALAEPTRLSALRLLWTEDEICLCHIAQNLHITQSRASRHMDVLVRADIVSDRRKGPYVLYRINKKMPKRFMDPVRSVVEALPPLKLAPLLSK